MAIPLIPILTVASTIIDKIWPDPKVAAEAKLKVLELEQQGAFKDLEAQLQRDLAQINLNTEEAKSTNLFKSGWRPFIGWVCGGGLFYQFLWRPLSEYIVNVVAFASGADMSDFPTPPSLDVETLMTLLFGMLGLGVYRTYERVKDRIPRGE